AGDCCRRVLAAEQQCPNQRVRGRARLWSKQLTAQQKPKADPTTKIPGPTFVPRRNAANTANRVAIAKAPADSATTTCGLRLYALPTTMTTVAPSSDASATHK